MMDINASDNDEEFIAYEDPKKPIDIVGNTTTKQSQRSDGTKTPYYTPTGGTSRQEHVSRREVIPPVWGYAPRAWASRESHGG
jgi:hypothetical protein